MSINIAGLDHADVLRVLYNNSKAQGMGWLHFTPEPMNPSEAKSLTDEYQYFDYVHGRVIKVELKKEATEFDERLYDRDNGLGAAQRAIDSLREK